MRIKNAKFTIGFVCIYFQKSEEVRQNFEHSSGCENITHMSPLWHISASDKESPEFSRYGAYRRILSKKHYAGILLTGQYANGLGLPEKRMLLWEGVATDDKTKSYFGKM